MLCGRRSLDWTLTVFLAWTASTVLAGEFETPPVFSASDILAKVPETLSGENFRVREEVLNDGYWDFYTIDTPFGVFYAHGYFDLRNTIREINAIAELKELSGTRVFAEAVLDKGLEPLAFASQIIQHPIQTISNVPRGIVQMFQRYARRAGKVLEVAGKVTRGDRIAKQENPRLAEACERGAEPYPGACDEEGYADDFGRLTRRYFDVNDVRREYHRELGTDPYSSNEVLQDAITRMSWIGGIGEFGTRKLSLWKRVEVVDLVGQMYKLAWNRDPFELRKYLDEVMAGNGIPAEERNYFLNNPYLTPSKQSFIVRSLENLDGVEGREHILHWSADSRNEDEALYSTATVALITWYHGMNEAVRFIPNLLMPVIETREGDLVALHPIDHLSWTEEVATILQAGAEHESMPANRPRVLWLLNRASDRARQEIEALGYQLVEDGYKDILASGKSLEFNEPAPDSG